LDLLIKIFYCFQSLAQTVPTVDGRRIRAWLGYFRTMATWSINESCGPLANGTSFSAPQITAWAAGIWAGKTRIGPRIIIIEDAWQWLLIAEKPDNQLGLWHPRFPWGTYGENTSARRKSGAHQSGNYSPNPIDGRSIDHLTFRNSTNCEFTCWISKWQSGLDRKV